MQYVAQYMQGKDILYPPLTRVEVISNISWSPPTHGWVRINCNGTSTDGFNNAGCGGGIIMGGG